MLPNLLSLLTPILLSTLPIPIFSLPLTVPHPSSLATTCKSHPLSPTWPSPALWSTLNSSISGNLLSPIPPGAVCHSTHPAYNITLCTEVQIGWSDEYFHQADPVSSEWNNWNNDSCLPVEGVPCSGVGYPVFVVDAMDSEDVRRGVMFAKQHDIRLIVKSSGHDYVGRSSAPNALSIWVHHLKSFEFHASSFRPLNCGFDIFGPAVTAGGGSQMVEMYRALDAFNHTVVGGNGRTVALGGYVTGAGHSILSPRYGLAADQVLEMEVVTPMGEVVVANECQNEDLFWAMRGGGGSTFGIMTSVTMKAYPTPQVLNLDFSILTDAANPHVFDMIAYFLGQYGNLSEAGVSGYPLIFNSAPNVFDGGQTFVSGVVGKVIMLNATNSSSITSLFTSMFDHINTTWPNPGFNFTANTRQYQTFNAWYQENYDSSPVGYENVMGSRLLDEQSLTANATATKMAFEKFSAGGIATVYLVAGKGVAQAVPRGGSNAVGPAWRRTLAHATANAVFTPLNKTAETDAIAATNGFADALRELTPGMGAYINEGAGRYEPNWQESFWGENYARLVEIKRAVDPDDVLWCAPCVGNEGWEEVDNMLCRVQMDLVD